MRKPVILHLHCGEHKHNREQTAVAVVQSINNTVEWPTVEGCAVVRRTETTFMFTR